MFLKSKAFPLLVILIAMTAITMALSGGNFLSTGNLLTVFYGMVIQIAFLCGIGPMLISGNIDLSVGGQAALSTMIFAWLCKNTKMPWGIVLLITICVAVCFGLINTFLVNKLQFPSFIATIGMASVYSGLCSVMNKGDNIQISRGSYIAIGKTNLFGWMPASFVFVIILLIIFQFMLSYTRFGRSIFMVGGNQQSARLSGLNPNRIRMALFIINSILACIGGLLWSAQAKLASPTAIISGGMDMRVISAAILGGIAFFGGSGNLISAFVGVLLLNIFNNMLIVIGIPTYWTVFAQGLVLAVALAFDYFSTMRRQKALLAASAAAEAAEFSDAN